MRLDKLIFARGLAPSRSRAAALISEGAVTVDGRPASRPSEDVGDDAAIEIDNEGLHYVGRGAYKLLGALDAFKVDARGAVAADIGASTGGFTQVLLERGASRVYAVDSGRDQLAPQLRADPRVCVMEGCNARGLSRGDIGTVDIVVMDVSFISQALLYPAVCDILREGGDFISLIKPQFEVGREHIGGGGIVRDRRAREAAVLNLLETAADFGLAASSLIRSPIEGGDGNIEYLALFTAAGSAQKLPDGWERRIKEVSGEDKKCCTDSE